MPVEFTRRLDNLCDVFNGDIRNHRPEHWCGPDCCINRDASVDRAFAAVVSMGLIPGLSAESPSQNRWGAVSTSNAEQAAAIALHYMLPQIVTLAFPRWEDGADVGDHTYIA